MKRTRSKSAQPRLSRDADRLVTLANGLGASGSRVEDRFWEKLLETELVRLLDHGSDTAMEAALDHLHQINPLAYDGLVDLTETLAESQILSENTPTPVRKASRRKASVESDQTASLIAPLEAMTTAASAIPHEVLLIAAPVLAWSHYGISSGPLRSDAVEELADALRQHIAATDTKLTLSPILYSIDQLPSQFSDVRELTSKLARKTLGQETPVTTATVPETQPLLADTRYLLAVLVAPVGAPLLHWQQEMGEARVASKSQAAGGTAIVAENLDQVKSKAPARTLAKESNRDAIPDQFLPVTTPARETAAARWREAATPIFTKVLPGCTFELLLPDGYHVACRDSDRAIRPLSLRAALGFLEITLETPADKVHAVIAPFGEEQIEEYRIGLALSIKGEIVHGVLWPLYAREEGPEPGGPLEQITSLLKTCGVTHIRTLDTLFPPEFCDDCGSPIYADGSGDLVHVEFPEESEPPARPHLH